MARRYYSSIAAKTTLTADISSGAVTMGVTAVVGWPATFPYTLILDVDTVTEEVVTVTGRSGTTITITRASDGTTASAHSAGGTVQHGVSARDFDEPNAFINGTGFVSPTLADAKGDLIVATADDTLARLAVGTDDYVVTADSGETGGMKWAQPGATPTQNTQTGTTYTAVLLDAGKTVTLSNASAVTLTIPAQASVSWADNTQLNFLNLGAGTVTITAAAGVTINGTPLTLATSKGGSLVRTASNTWTFTPSGGGGGKVLQVVRATDSTNRSTSSASFVDANISVTITPQKTTSNILLIWAANTAVYIASGTIVEAQFAITDSANNLIGGLSKLFMKGASTSNLQISTNMSLIRWASPATLSATTYKGRINMQSGTSASLDNASQGAGQLFAIEVAP